MAGKSWQPSHEPPRGREKNRQPSHWKTVERKGGAGEGRQPPRSPHTQENANAQKMLTEMSKTATTPFGPRTRGILLTAKVKLVLLVVNSVKLHLTACNFFILIHVHCILILQLLHEDKVMVRWSVTLLPTLPTVLHVPLKMKPPWQNFGSLFSRTTVIQFIDKYTTHKLMIVTRQSQRLIWHTM